MCERERVRPCTARTRAHAPTHHAESSALDLQLARHGEGQPLSEVKPEEGMRLLHLQRGDGVLTKINLSSNKPFHVEYNVGGPHRYRHRYRLVLEI